MNQLNEILQDAQIKNENNKRETRNYLTKSLIQYQKVLDHYKNENANSQIKKEIILVDEEKSNSSSQATQLHPQQKMKYIDILKKKPEEKNITPNKELFKGKIFIFYMRTINLSEKRIKIISDQIKQNQGEVYTTIQEYFDKYQTFYDLIQEQNKDIFFICPDEAKTEDIKKELSIYSLNIEAIWNRVIKVEYLVETLKQKKQLSADTFYVFNSKQHEIINDFSSVSVSLELKKIKEEQQQAYQPFLSQQTGLKKLKEEKIENNKTFLSQQICVQNEFNNAQSYKISSDDDSNQDSQNFDLECITDVSHDIVKQRKAESDKSRLKEYKNTRYLWDYNYDSNQPQDSVESELSQNSKKIKTIDPKTELIDIEYDDNQITPQKGEQELLLSKIIEEQSAPKSIFKSQNYKLKKCVSETEDHSSDVIVSYFKQNEQIQLNLIINQESVNSRVPKVKTSIIKKQQKTINIKKNINQLFSNQNSNLNNGLLLDYNKNDSDQEDKQEEFYEEEFDEEELQYIDSRFIKEISAKKESSKEKANNVNNNNNSIKILKKSPIQIIQLESDEEENDIKFDQMDKKLYKINNNIITDIIVEIPFQPHSEQMKREKYWDERKDRFVCATGVPKENLNKIITDELEKLLKIYQQEKDLGRSIAYRKAVGVIKSLDFQITSVKDIQAVHGIGDKTKDKIKEILQTGQCQRAQILTQNERNQSIELLSKVWGIGPSTAIQLYERGIKSIEDLRQNQQFLNKNQKIGLTYFEDIAERMPRDEATQIIEEIKKGFSELYPNEYDRFDIIACGSYRRGKETCGDVDILICRKDGEENKPKKLMNNLVSKLEQIGLLIEHLQLPKLGSHGSETYMGIGKLQGGKHRRIDFKYYPKDLYGYALLYFTGSDYFNRSMRLFARKKGYSLSDHGLYPVVRVDNKTKITSSITIPCYTEEEVFAALNLEYKTPEMRSV